MNFNSFIGYLIEAKQRRVGKEIGGSTYLHKSYADNHPRIPQEELNQARGILAQKHPDHKYNIVRYGYAGTDKGSFSFINSPDFDENPEPTVADAIRVNPDGATKITRQKKDPQIYHHKHEFVGDDYQGFDVDKSKRRSEIYNPIIDKLKETNPKIRSRMGTKSVWDNEVIPHIKDHVNEEYSNPLIPERNFKDSPASELLALARQGHPHAVAELRRRGITVSEVYHHRDVFRAGIKHKVSSHGGYLIHQNGDSITIKTMNGNKVSTRGKAIDSLSDAIHFINHDLRKGFKPSNPAQRTIREENDLEIGTDKLVYDRRSKTPGENASKPIPYPDALKNFLSIMEAYYPGNIGIMELAKFMQTATEKQKRMFHDHLANSRHEKAMGLVSKVTGMQIHPSAYKNI